MKNLFVALAVIAFCAGEARADRTNSCRKTGYNLWPVTTVDIWVNNTASQGLQNSLGLSIADTEMVVQRAINILNEEVGSAMHFKYRGQTTATGYVYHSVVLRGAGCSASSNAAAITHWDTSGIFTLTPDASTIDFYAQSGASCNPIDWSTAEDDGHTGIVPVIFHEMGHAVFMMNHVGDTPAAPACEDIGQPTVMRPTTGFPFRANVLKPWDIEVFQQRYHNRALSSQFWKRFRSGPTTWSTPGAPSQPMHPLFRPGSMPQTASRRILGHQANATTLSYFGGAGYTYNVYYSAGWHSQNLLVPNVEELPRPIATAQQIGTSETILVYQKAKYGAGYYGVDSDIGYVCYRYSYDESTTYGPETCVADANHEAHRYGLTVAYDPVSQMFIVGYVNTGHQLAFWTINTSTSGHQENTTILSNYKAWHAPSIACGPSGSGNCVVTYDADNNAGTVSYFRAEVNLTSPVLPFRGKLAATTSAMSTGLLGYDTPSVVYNPSGNEFVMAVTQHGFAAYGYTMPFTGSFWTGVGDIWNDSSTFISTVVLGVRLHPGANPSGDYTQAWWLKYQ